MKKKKILVVDDNPVMQKQIVKLLGQEGHRVAAAQDGVEALDLLTSFIPDILFVDLIMPKIGGDKLCQLIRKMPHLKDCYLVIVSAAAAELEFDYKKIGADACIAKGPYDVMTQHILAAIEESECSVPEGKPQPIKGLGSVFARRITKELLSRSYHLETILESLPEGILEIFSGRIIYVNSAAGFLLGLPLEKVLGSNPIDLFDPEMRSRIESLLKLERGEPSEMTLDASIALNNKQVTIKNLHVKEESSTTILLITDVTKQKQAEIVLRREHDELEKKVRRRTLELEKINLRLKQKIEEHKRAENEIRQARKEWEGIFQAIGHPTFILDPDRNILLANSAAVTGAKLSHEELKGRKCHHIMHGVHPPPVDCPLEKMSMSGQLEACEMEIETLKGWYLISCTPVYDEKGRIEKVIHIATDVTKRKRAEKELQKSEEQYRTLVETANDAIFIAQDGVLKFANQKTFEMSGYTAEELLQIPFADLVHPGDRDFVLNMHQRRLKGEDLPSTYSFKIINKSGKVLWVQLSVVLIAWEGKPATLNFLRDISPQKQLEDQLLMAQKMEAIGTLAGGITHDFNNILGAIFGYAEIAKDDVTEGSPVYMYLEQILTAGDRARELVKQILTFSRRAEEQRIPVKISLIVKEAIKLLRASLPTTIKIRKRIEQENDIVEADPTQIHQVLMNLCTNAAHAMREKGGILSVSSNPVELDINTELPFPDPNPGPYIKLTVSDTGHGMKPEVLERIFDPYFTTKEKDVGTGLGLATTHGIVKSHGGAVTVHSEPGKGSTFSVYFPVIVKAPRIEEEKTEPIPTGNERILFVDDEKDLLGVGKLMLEKLGYDVLCYTKKIGLSRGLSYFSRTELSIVRCLRLVSLS